MKCEYIPSGEKSVCRRSGCGVACLLADPLLYPRPHAWAKQLLSLVSMTVQTFRALTGCCAQKCPVVGAKGSVNRTREIQCDSLAGKDACHLA